MIDIIPWHWVLNGKFQCVGKGLGLVDGQFAKMMNSQMLRMEDYVWTLLTYVR